MVYKIDDPNVTPKPDSLLYKIGSTPNTVNNYSTGTQTNPTKPSLASLMGNGGANYNTADAATRQSIVDNETKLNADPNFRNSEIQRALQVRTDRQGSNMDVTDQNNYLARLGYTDPAQPTGTDLIKSIYDKNYAAQSQKLRSLRDTQLAGLAGQEDVINQNKVSGLNANDVLANNNWRSLKESMANAGVNGGDSVTAQIGNQTAQQQGAVDINNNASNQLKQLMAQRAAINDNAAADDFAMMQQLQGTRDTQLLGDLYKNRDFNYQVGRDTVGDSQWNKSFGLQTDEADARKRKEHIDLANLLSEQYGVHVDPKDDPALAYSQVAGLTPLAKQTLDFNQNIASRQLDNSTRQTNATIGNMSADNARAAAAEATQNGDKELAMKFNIWEKTGVAPAGIPGVAAGTPLKGSGQTPVDKNAATGDLVASIEQMTPENKTKFFKEQKSNIIAEHGLAGYNQLYGMYFDKYGDPL